MSTAWHETKSRLLQRPGAPSTPCMDTHTTEPMSAYAALGRLQREAPSLQDALVAAAECDASHRRDIVNSLNLGDQAVLQSLNIVALDQSAGRLDVTDFGHEVIDAAAIVADDDLTPEEHQQLEEEAHRRFHEMAERDQSLVTPE